MKNILLGLEHCHANDIMHLDLKPSNILICYNSATRSYDAKITDFGISRVAIKTLKPYYPDVILFF